VPKNQFSLKLILGVIKLDLNLFNNPFKQCHFSYKNYMIILNAHLASTFCLFLSITAWWHQIVACGFVNRIFNVTF
jgi:hypothetical protein